MQVDVKIRKKGDGPRKLPAGTIKRMYAQGKTFREIAEHVGASESGVGNFVYRNGLARRRDRRAPEVEKEATRTGDERKGDAAKPKREPVASPLPPRPKFPEERDLALMRSDGSWEAIDRLAGDWGLEYRLVIGRWHQLRAARLKWKMREVAA